MHRSLSSRASSIFPSLVALATLGALAGCSSADSATTLPSAATPLDASLDETSEPRTMGAPDGGRGASAETDASFADDPLDAAVAVEGSADAAKAPFEPIAEDASSTAISAGPFAVTVTDGVSYGPTPSTGGVNVGWASGNTLDLCQPKPTEGQWKGPYPGIIFIHGGAWVAGTKEQDDPQCHTWATYGYVAITIDYRLQAQSGSHAGTPWPASIVDSQAAVRWLRTNAARLQLDPEKIVAFGDSAGGQLVEYLAYYQGQVPSTKDDVAALYPGVSSSVTAIVSEFGPSLFGPGGVTTMDLLEKHPDGNPYTVLVQGTLDTTVPPDNSEDVEALLTKNGDPVSYISYVGKHEFVDATSADVNHAKREEMDSIGRYLNYLGSPVLLP